MQIFPTRATFHVALAGAALVAVGVASRLTPMVAFGGAMILAVAAGRGLAWLAVTRLRSAGFEMAWLHPTRTVRVARSSPFDVIAELRNRGPDPVRAVAIRPIASSVLDVEVTPTELTLGADSRARITLRVRPLRVGSWGLHGLALEVRATPARGEGLYEVPLLFANPFGVEVVSTPLHALLSSPLGGRGRRGAALGRPSNAVGEGDELRELRDHVPGDPFKRIAWKASAKRGQLLVRDMEREEREVVWLVLDASVELWAGPMGHAPLDDGVDEVAALAAAHLRAGDRTGLAVVASRLRSFVRPAQGAQQAVSITRALTDAANLVDADRSDLDEQDVALRVFEHARSLDGAGLADVASGDLDGLALRAEALLERAPFVVGVPFARTAREQVLRRHLAAYGIEVPPRPEGERQRTEATLTEVLGTLLRERPCPTVVHVWAPAPLSKSPVLAALRRLRLHRVELRWSMPNLERGLGGHEAVQEIVDEAVRVRARAARHRGQALLRRVGVRCVSPVRRAG
ncbi:MAG: DUF58 domain-containing protein [Myxococcales bacterium]